MEDKQNGPDVLGQKNEHEGGLKFWVRRKSSSIRGALPLCPSIIGQGNDSLVCPEGRFNSGKGKNSARMDFASAKRAGDEVPM